MIRLMQCRLPVFTFLFALVGSLLFSGCNVDNVDEGELLREREDQLILEYLEENNLEAERTPEGLYYRLVEAGNIERKPIPGNQVIVHYEGRLLDGKLFDSSRLRGETFEFQLGVGQVIQGWDIGLQLMDLGEVAELYIPSYLAYGDRGSGNVIPPNTILVFEIELLGIN